MKYLINRIFAAIAVAVLTTGLVVTNVDKGHAVEDFYKGRTITILSGHPPG